MIRFVDVSKDLAEDGQKFAWWNTIVSEFEVHSGSMAWETWAEFKEDCQGDLERYKRLFKGEENDN